MNDEAKLCLMPGCGNRSNEGRFIGRFCAPCVELIAEEEQWGAAFNITLIADLVAKSRTKQP